MVYAESSVLTSLVMRDFNSAKALQLTEKQESPLLFNVLLKLEVCNAIRFKVAAGELDEVAAAESGRKVEEMEKSGMWLVVEPEWERAFQRSVGFSKAHTAKLRTRSIDILHVAAAVELGATEFWSFDKRQRELAAAVGLSLNP